MNPDNRCLAIDQIDRINDDLIILDTIITLIGGVACPDALPEPGKLWVLLNLATTRLRADLNLPE